MTDRCAGSPPRRSEEPSRMVEQLEQEFAALKDKVRELREYL